jgi:restriction system protein
MVESMGSSRKTGSVWTSSTCRQGDGIQTLSGGPRSSDLWGLSRGNGQGKGSLSAFSEPSQDYVACIDSKIVLIDRETLAHLIIDYGIGVTTTASYDLKRVDSDYFTEE